MSIGKADKPCIAYKYWPTNPGLCGVCAWEKDEHNGAHVRSNLAPHQIRVIHELRDLEDKREKLEMFLKSNPVFENLPNDEKGRLIDQSKYMMQYAQVLRDRVKAFL